jgi:hypothetical protein
VTEAIVARMKSLIAVLIVLSACIAAESVAFADSHIEITNEFTIYRGLGRIQIRKLARVYFDSDKIYLGDSDTEDTSNTKKLREQAISQLGRIITFVEERTAEYKLMIRMERHQNFAIRSSKRAPSVGFVALSLCRYPIGNVMDDCQNLTFYFFRNYSNEAVFEQVLKMLAERVIK